jgi:NAD(P)-dependent dehydrogenase (short-subunit alcohol dehydrogenase family)
MMKPAILILDAANGIGRGVTEVALEAGQPVVAVSTDRAYLAELVARHPEPRLVAVEAGVTSDAEGAALARRLRDLARPLAGVVIANCREPSRGRVIDQSLDTLEQRLFDDLRPQFALARHLLPLLASAGRNGGYVVIGSPGSEQPWAGYGIRSISSAANAMLVRVLHDEARSLGVRVQMLAIRRPAQTHENARIACAGWPAATDIARQALALVAQRDPQLANTPVVMFDPGESARAPRAASSHERNSRAAALAAAPDLLAQQTLDRTWDLLRPILDTNARRHKP